MKRKASESGSRPSDPSVRPRPRAWNTLPTAWRTVPPAEREIFVSLLLGPPLSLESAVSLVGPDLSKPRAVPHAVHPYVYQRYLAPLLPGLRNVASATVDLPSAHVPFASLNPTIIIAEIARAVRERIKDLRNRPAAQLHRLARKTSHRFQDRTRIATDLAPRARRFLSPKQLELGGADVVVVYLTVYYSGTFFLELLHDFSDLEDWIRRRARISQEAKGMRSARDYLLRRIRPESSLRMREDVDWILASLKRISPPHLTEVRHVRRQLHVHRSLLRLHGHQFWRDIAAWGVEALLAGLDRDAARRAERFACSLIAEILFALFPDSGPWSGKAIRAARYYRLK